MIFDDIGRLRWIGVEMVIRNAGEIGAHVQEVQREVGCHEIMMVTIILPDTRKLVIFFYI